MINIQNYSFDLHVTSNSNWEVKSKCRKCENSQSNIYSKRMISEIDNLTDFLTYECEQINHEKWCNANCEFCKGAGLVERFITIHEEPGNPNMDHQEGTGEYDECICQT